MSVTDWAQEHRFPKQAVYAVLSGKSRCSRGRGHRIAIALGMKEPIDEVTLPDSPCGITQQRKALKGEALVTTVHEVESGQLAVTSVEEAYP